MGDMNLKRMVPFNKEKFFSKLGNLNYLKNPTKLVTNRDH